MPIISNKKMPCEVRANTIEREADEIELNLMALKRQLRVRKLTLGQMAFGSDEAAEAAFRKIVSAYQ